MEEGGVLTLTKPIFPRPKLVVQPRNSREGFIQGGLNSATPTPMIFGSSLRVDYDPNTDCKPLSSLLVEALGSATFSPMAFFNHSGTKRTATDSPTSNDNETPAQTESDGMAEAPVDSQSISSARYRAMMPSRLPISSTSPHLTIPPGISPASLLDSPILFNMRQTDPSPTTGSFSMPPYTHGIKNASMGDDCVKIPERNDSFIFKPHPVEEKYESPENIGIGIFGIHAEETVKRSDEQWQPQIRSKDLCSDVSSDVLAPQDHPESRSMASASVMPTNFHPISHGSGATNHSNARLPSDGYNWKKYGQKTLKNTEIPRSYYKCTHAGCLAKKQVEWEIIRYKGIHNHAKPQGTRKRAKNGALVVQNSTGAHHEHDRVVQAAIPVSMMIHDKASGDLSSSFVHLHGGLPGTPEDSFTSPSNEDDENGDTSMVADDCEDEHYSKHRWIDSENGNVSRESVRTSREPRVVVQTVSEKEILDDGYRWRKYGQKVVKGHHYPRNYYKCTSIGCTVRKQVERSSSDTKCVMTTYEGKHYHGVPPARGNKREIEEDAMTSAASYPSSPAHVYSEGTHTF